MIKLKTLSQIVARYGAKQRKQSFPSIAHAKTEGYRAGYLKAMQDVRSVIEDGLDRCYSNDTIVSHVRAACKDETRLT